VSPLVNHVPTDFPADPADREFDDFGLSSPSHLHPLDELPDDRPTLGPGRALGSPQTGDILE
jgi:hypothetical protein